ncbi:hypothetical protein F751_1056 [Auxenochlorella protothecoides]|uniref:Uncharacterized protein n=1 Tax=Auxenochlorella protothecoides TaxID=3075 RepID=A0A087SCA6_AUXPR|nr:hypothetical protein F751_1056 [Auxenochlorella protothecoides]KFM23360.1 hypothetical protein F751_1056 [Auxenochlorella protothecoides]
MPVWGCGVTTCNRGGCLQRVHRCNRHSTAMATPSTAPGGSPRQQLGGVVCTLVHHGR